VGGWRCVAHGEGLLRVGHMEERRCVAHVEALLRVGIWGSSGAWPAWKRCRARGAWRSGGACGCPLSRRHLVRHWAALLAGPVVGIWRRLMLALV
jgi:hypothetical protein